MTGRKALLPLSLIVSGISNIIAMLPFIFIWLIVRELIAADNSDFTRISTYAWLALGFAVASVAFYFLALSLSHLAAFRAENQMRKVAMKRIIELPLGFFDNNTTGRIRKIIDDNAGITHTFLAHQMPDLAGSLIMPIVTFILIFAFDWRLGLVCLIPIALSILIMGFMMGKKGRYFMNAYMNSLEEMNTEAVEYVRGIPVVKVFQQTVYSFKNFYNSIIKYRDLVSVYTKLWEKPMSLYTVIINGFSFFLIPAAILIISRTGNNAQIIVDLFLFLLLTPVFAQSIMKSMYMNQAFGQANEAVKRMEDLINVDKLELSKNPKQIYGFNIEFKNVSFKYPNADKNAVDNVSFEVPKGKTFALVGPSGSGKTTIARLIPRFWDVIEGEVSIGGINVKDLDPKDLMRNVSFVFQNSKLFKTSILENVRYGNPNADMNQIADAIKAAQCIEIINRLPKGINTKIGIEGTYLSGGEQQRIALARAFLKNAPIVLLDEATAFADPENEYLIQKALRELTKGKTVLMIAHRLTSVTEVDSILVVEHGKIVERGNHIELLNKKGLYLKMWNEYQKSVQWTIGKEVQHV